MNSLDKDITSISRVGAATAKKLKKLDVRSVQDLLFYFPFRYEDYSRITPISELLPGTIANIAGQIELIQNKRSARRKMSITEALVSDGVNSIKAIWFNQPFIIKSLNSGDYVSLAGKIEEGFSGTAIVSPTYERLGRGQTAQAQGFVPVYHLTSDISQKQLRFLVRQILNLANDVKDWLPEPVKKKLHLLGLPEAIKKVHFPKNLKESEQARRRLAFDELLLVQLQAQMIKSDLLKSTAEQVRFSEDETRAFTQKLPFTLTDSQKKCAWEILRDIEKDQPMARLLEGDVGSGKTLVAMIAMLNAALAGKQSVLMVPTEILAKQHYATFCKYLADFDIKIGLVTRSEKRLNYESGIMNQESGEKKKSPNSQFITANSNIIIGTHALIQEKIEFNDLALVVIDEQHRFGVEQRKALIDKSGNKKTTPHLLSMTATPIPRSLALAIYGDLDISIISEMPKGRKKVLTKIVSEYKRQQAYEFIRKEISAGGQVFVICPLIDFSDPLRHSYSEASKLGVKSVKDEYEKLSKIIFPDLSIGMLHGKMKAKEKDEIMQAFLDKKIKILVSTSVVEVGVDVPSATIMMVEGADRFGLAQLHQFRGRVGRGERQAYCFLFTDSTAQKTTNRLQALVDNYDGFKLAKIDLKFRGPGEVYGTMQKGFPELKIASLFDYELMKLAKQAAEKLITEDRDLKTWPLLKEKAGQWNGDVHLE